MKKMTITGRIQEIADTAVVARVGQERYDAIKRLDPHPCWVELRVAKVGDSTGVFVVDGKPRNVRKRWSAERIQELAELMNEPNPFRAADIIVGHDDAEAVRGKLVAGWTDNDEACGLAVVSDPDTQRDLAAGKLNTCSLDVVAGATRLADNTLQVDTVKRLSKIALADSRIERPGFKSAQVMGVIQELEDKDKEKPMKLSEIKAAIEEGGWKPEQLHAKEALLAVPFLQDAVKAEAGEVQKKLTEQVKKLEAEKGELAKELQPVREQKQREGIKTAALASALLKDKPHGLRDFVADRLPASIASIEDAAKRQEAIDAAIKTELDTVAKYKIQFPPATGNPPPPNAPAAGGQQQATGGNKYMDPAQNPAIAT